MRTKTTLGLLLGVFFLVLLWSGTGPYDRFTWYLEVAPAVLGLAVVAATRSRFPLSMLAYGSLTVHAVILMIGGKYTYALVPAGFWVRDALHLARNHYDRVGHFAQGFVPALVIREVLLRNGVLKNDAWLKGIVVSIALALSAFYEFIEWWVSLLTGSAGDSFLGTQGDVWDTQWDMFLCFVGATLSVLLLGRLHDRSMARVGR
jgi:putative membrane protein